MKDTHQKFIKIMGIELPIPFNETKKEYYSKIIELVESEMNSIKAQVSNKNIQISMVQLSLLGNIRMAEKYNHLLSQYKSILENYKTNVSHIRKDLVEISDFIDTYVNTSK